MNINNIKKLIILLLFLICILYVIKVNYSINKSNDDDRLKPNKIPPRIFCIILTQPKNLLEKAKNIFNSWANKCDEHLFVSVVIITKNNLTSQSSLEYTTTFGMRVLQPFGHYNESYNELTDKVYLTIKDVYKRYNIYNYDWFLKADDDTFILMDNLRLFLNDKNANQPITYGFNFKDMVEEGYHSGGAGYLLSRNAFRRLGSKLNRNYDFCPNSGIEDIDVAKCLRQLKVHLGNSTDSKGRERFHPLSIYNHYQGYFPDWLTQVLLYT
jgi:glycoprotein-N-acetylgalactosamine 3-beta-galactosyltransferase